MKKVFLLIFVVTGFALVTAAQTTEFTYQGKLTDNGTPASGVYQMQFSLFSAASGGTPIGNETITNSSVSVNNGIFTVNLDFTTANIFDGSQRWLEIAVKKAAEPLFTTLSPRQLVTSAPYAVRSLNASSANVSTNSLELGGIAANQYVITSDSRMSDARPPLPGSANYIQNGTGQQPLSNFNVSGTGKSDTFDAATQFNIGGNRVLANSGIANLFAGTGTGAANTGDSNSFVGASAGNANTSGRLNSFFGSQAGWKNTTGVQNAFFGSLAGAGNTTASFNSFFGMDAGENNTVGGANSFFGEQTGQNNTTGTNNSFFGALAGGANVTGTNNSFFGRDSGLNNTADNNSFFGRSSGFANTTGTLNSFFGLDSGRFNTTGNFNSAFGHAAGFNTTTGGQNTFLGNNAGLTNTIGSNNTYLGGGTDSVDGLSFATAVGSGSTVSSSNTVALGRSNGSDTVVVYGLGTAGDVNLCQNSGTKRISTCANQLVIDTDPRLSDSRIPTSGSGFYVQNGTLQQSSSNFNISGTGSAAVLNASTQFNIGGSRAFTAVGGGSQNVFAGINSGSAVTSGFGDTFVGNFAGNVTTSGSNNSFYGADSGRTNSGSGNSFFGRSSGFATTGGGNNSFFGLDSGRFNTSGSNNSAFGQGAGFTNTSGSNNTYVGAGADSSDGLVFATAIGSGAHVFASNVIILGRPVPNSSTVGPDTVAIPGNIQTDGSLSFEGGLTGGGTTHLCFSPPNDLRVLACSSSLRYKTNVQPFTRGLDLVKKLRPITFDWKKSGLEDVGLGAEDVEKAEPLLVTYDQNGQVDGVKYDRVTVVLLNAMREQQQQIEALRKLVCSLKPKAELCKSK